MAHIRSLPKTLITASKIETDLFHSSLISLISERRRDRFLSYSLNNYYRDSVWERTLIWHGQLEPKASVINVLSQTRLLAHLRDSCNGPLLLFTLGISHVVLGSLVPLVPRLFYTPRPHEISPSKRGVSLNISFLSAMFLYLGSFFNRRDDKERDPQDKGSRENKEMGNAVPLRLTGHWSRDPFVAPLPMTKEDLCFQCLMRQS